MVIRDKNVLNFNNASLNNVFFIAEDDIAFDLRVDIHFFLLSVVIFIASPIH